MFEKEQWQKQPTTHHDKKQEKIKRPGSETA